MGHFLGYACCLFSDLILLCLLGVGGEGDVDCRKSFCWAFLAKKAVSGLELGAQMTGG